MKPNELKKLAGFGFDTAPGRQLTINKHRRLIMSACAPEKAGKTRFGLSTPKPIMYLNFDRKIEQTVLDSLGISESDLYIKEVRVDAEVAQDEHKRIWGEVRDAFLWALHESRDIRSIVVDTETEMWELARISEFGQLTQVMPYQYTQLNAMYKYLLDQCDQCDKNVILLRKLRKEYKNDKWSGRYEVSGFGKAKDIVQVNAEMYREEDEDGQDVFILEILNNGLIAGMNHQTFSGEMCSFPWVAAMLTGTTPDEWE
jgi:hypothetical protein